MCLVDPKTELDQCIPTLTFFSSVNPLQPDPASLAVLDWRSCDHCDSLLLDQKTVPPCTDRWWGLKAVFWQLILYAGGVKWVHSQHRNHRMCVCAACEMDKAHPFAAIHVLLHGRQQFSIITCPANPVQPPSFLLKSLRLSPPGFAASPLMMWCQVFCPPVAVRKLMPLGICEVYPSRHQEQDTCCFSLLLWWLNFGQNSSRIIPIVFGSLFTTYI